MSFDLLNPKWQDIGKLDIKSADGNRLHSIDFRSRHRLTQPRVDELDQLLHDYHEALAAATNALYRVAQWAAQPVEDGGNFEQLVMMLPDVARALELVGVDIDETAVTQL